MKCSDSSCSHFFAGNPNARYYTGEVISLTFLIDRYDLKVSGTPYIYSKKKGRSNMDVVRDTFDKPIYMSSGKINIFNKKVGHLTEKYYICYGI